MTEKLITHDEAYTRLVYGDKVIWHEKQFLEDYIRQNEQRDKDVARLLKINRDLRPFIEELETLKKPPTVEEVCKALSEHLAIDVSYGAKQFYYTIENTECIMFVTETYGDGLWSINEYLPSHLITLIGRFYESLEEN